MTWFQVAYDEGDSKLPWTVLQLYTHNATGDVSSLIHSRWPTEHEAAGHARKALKRFA